MDEKVIKEATFTIIFILKFFIPIHFANTYFNLDLDIVTEKSLWRFVNKVLYFIARANALLHRRPICLNNRRLMLNASNHNTLNKIAFF